MVDVKPPKMGQIVLFEANDGSGQLQPAIVLRTKGDIVRDMERVGPYMDVEMAFPNEFLADLLLLGPNGHQFEQRVPYHPAVKGPDEAGLGARTWHYPPK